MANPGPRDDLFRLYLTRNLPDKELSELSDRLLQEPELSDELVEFETEWIDARINGELTPDESAQVDAYLEQTGQQHRLTTARRLSAHASESRPVAPHPHPNRRPALYWLAAAAAVLIAVAVWQFHTPPASSPTTVANSPNPASTPPFAILLTPGTRSASPRRAVIPPGAANVELKLALDAPLAPGSYHAVLQSAAGTNLLSQTVLLAQGGTSLSLVLPAALLPSGSYTAFLYMPGEGDDLINAYAFQISAQ